MRNVLLIGLVAIAGCGDGASSTANDAAIDAPKLIDAPEPAAGFTHYVIDKVLVPTSNTTAREYGLDLNNDSYVDNQFGMVLSTFSSMGLDSQAAMNKSVDHGDIIMLARLGALDFTTDAMSTFTIFQGDNPMPSPCTSPQDMTCRKHLTGMASFSVKPSSPIDPPLVGTIATGKLTAGPGHLTLQFSMAFSPAVTVTLLGARVDFTTTKTALTGKLGGAIAVMDIDTKLKPAMRDGLEALVAKDCTMLSSPPTAAARRTRRASQCSASSIRRRRTARSRSPRCRTIR